jgi:hypothetical protein
MKRHVFSGLTDPFHHPIQNQVFFSYEDYRRGEVTNQYIYMVNNMVIKSITQNSAAARAKKAFKLARPHRPGCLLK